MLAILNNDMGHHGYEIMIAGTVAMNVSWSSEGLAW